jgi:ATP-dependent RNA helicase DeaD
MKQTLVLRAFSWEGSSLGQIRPAMFADSAGQSPRGAFVDINAFAALGCSNPFLEALSKRGYSVPTPVQAEAIPHGLAGKDLLVQSCTGSGKTLAFGLPLLQRLAPRKGAQAIVLTPTRELAQQVAAELKSVQPGLGVALLVGGMPYGPQERALAFGSPVVVGTPGRVMDHLDKKNLDLSAISMVVLDECDEMLNMGFLEDVEKILKGAPAIRQTYLFSATLPPPIAALAKRFLKDEVRLRLTSSSTTAAHGDITHSACRVLPAYRTRALANILLHDAPSAVLVFTRTKAESETVAAELRDAGLAADFLNGDLAQAARTRILGAFKAGRLPILVATDVAARGLDVEGLPLVVHLGIPTQMEGYIHRSGRTGRAGTKGTSLALVDPKETRILQAWTRRGGFELSWRTLPDTASIHEARLDRLKSKSAAVPGQAARERAALLLAGQDPVTVVASLLEAAVGKEADGFVIPAISSADERPFARTTFPGAKGVSSGPVQRFQPGNKPRGKGFPEKRPSAYSQRRAG